MATIPRYTRINVPPCFPPARHEHCIRARGAPLPNPDVASSSTVGTWLKTQTETGEVFRSAAVTEKTYLRTNKQVTASRDINANLARHSYTRTRTRSPDVSTTVKRVLGVPVSTQNAVFPGAWSSWSRSNGPPYSEKQSLALASPPFLPWCKDEGIPCP